MKNITVLFLPTFLAVIFNFCKPGLRKDRCDELDSGYQRVRDIGIDTLEIFIYKEFKDVESDLKLNQIECSTDSIQVRIWLGIGSQYKKYLWDCRFKEEEWAGNRIVYGEEESKTRVVAKLEEDRRFKPRTGWDLFFKEFMSLDIENKQSPLKFGVDGTSLTVEISKGSRYTFYVDVPEESELATKLFDLMKTNLEFESVVDNE